MTSEKKESPRESLRRYVKTALKDHLEQIEWLENEIKKQQKEYDGLIKSNQMTDNEKKRKLGMIHQLKEILRLEHNVRPKIERNIEILRKHLNEEGWK